MTELERGGLVLVTVGTDDFQFDRLIDWVDAWARDAQGVARVIIQCGTSKPPLEADWKRFMRPNELEELLLRASAVVCHGGVATIREALAHGLKPIVVPRLARFGECVDNHQLLFAERMARADQVLLVESPQELWHELRSALANPERVRTEPVPLESPVAVSRFEALVARLFK